MYLKKSYVYIALGSNINPIKHIKLSINSLKNIPQSEIIKISSFYKTKPYGGIFNQDDYINVVIFLNTYLSPKKIFSYIQLIENKYGRKRKKNFRWGPRTIDLDILLFDNLVINDKKLIIPHYDIINRIFVLVPLLEISPNIHLPDGRLLSLELEKFDLKNITKLVF